MFYCYVQNNFIVYGRRSCDYFLIVQGLWLVCCSDIIGADCRDPLPNTADTVSIVRCEKLLRFCNVKKTFDELKHTESCDIIISAFPVKIRFVKELTESRNTHTGVAFGNVGLEWLGQTQNVVLETLGVSYIWSSSTSIYRCVSCLVVVSLSLLSKDGHKSCDKNVSQYLYGHDESPCHLYRLYHQCPTWTTQAGHIYIGRNHRLFIDSFTIITIVIDSILRAI